MEEKPPTQTIDAQDLRQGDVIAGESGLLTVVEVARHQGHLKVTVERAGWPSAEVLYYGYEDGVEIVGAPPPSLCLPPPLQW